MGPEKQKTGNLASVRRLPSYLHLLRQASDNGRDIISSTYLAQRLNLDAIQIRKDLAITGIVGKTKVGYYVPSLITAIEDFLGWSGNNDAFIVGAGNLGRALIGYKGFKEKSLNIVAAFDSDEEKIGTEIADILVLPIEKLPDLADRMHVTTAIITVPEDAAQAAADIIVAAGIKVIWNFAPTVLQVPDGVVVQNEDLSSGLAVLTVKANRARMAQEMIEDNAADAVLK